VNVSNEDDRRELAGRGMDPGKIIVLPYALSRQRLEELQTCPVEPPSGSVVAFVGTFDMRKGCRDFPTLVDRVVGQVADARFRLVGTKGLFASAEEVLQHFPAKHRSRIEVIPRFDPVRLPELLSDCSLGVFPSYFEGFPFGVLEMLAANLPVVAYDAPGPPMMLTKEYLVPVGNPAALAERVVSLLQDRRRLASARLWAGQRARTFDWDQVARDTVARYLERVQQLRSDLQSPRTC
jgi:glycosyltransferase involved in cell wall biosynthesis